MNVINPVYEITLIINQWKESPKMIKRNMRYVSDSYVKTIKRGTK